MPYQHQWDDESQTIYLVTFFENWTWEEFSLAFREVYSLLASHSKKLDLIICFKGKTPKGNAIPHLRRAGGNQPPTIYRSVMVCEGNSLIEQLTHIIDKTQHWEGPAFVKTLDDARNLLKAGEEKV